MNTKLKNFLSQLRGKVLFDEPLSKHTWLGVGGPAEVMFSPLNADDLSFFLKNKPHDLPIYMLGGGSNLLVRDGGIKGVVIKLDSPYFKQILFENGNIRCFGGCLNASLKKPLIANALGGLEFLCSVPGTVGGALKSNAGCFGSSVADVLISADLMAPDGSIKTLKADDFHFAYRQSLIPEAHIILSVLLKTSQSTSESIQNTLDEQALYRKMHQPTAAKTAGSTFKNPQNLKAWALIKEAGCDTLQIGGAKVSDKHCNFLINTGTATAEDFETLGNTIVAKVKEKTGVTLEWEVQITGQKNEL